MTNDADWSIALRRALPEVAGFAPDALLVFASHHHVGNYSDLLREAATYTGAAVVIGCSAMGIIGMNCELERTPALALLAL
jgi:small ligand-binding sensory domain FIST